MGTPRIELSNLTALIEEAVQGLPGSVGPDTDLGSLDGWDSMGLVIFIELVQTKTGVELAVHDLRACTRPPEVAALIEEAARA
jgi:acyl carrier protein